MILTNHRDFKQAQARVQQIEKELQEERKLLNATGELKGAEFFTKIGIVEERMILLDAIRNYKYKS